VTGISHTRHYRFFTTFSVLILASSLTSAGILNGNMAISMDAYATKSEGSSGGSSDGGSSGGGSSDGGGGSSDKSGDNGGGTGGDNKPIIEEPSTPPPPPPPPPIEEPTPTLIAPPPPPPPTCEQGSPSPECSNVPEPPGPVDCSTNPNDPSCKTTEPTPPVDCTANPADPSCKTTPGPVDCSTNPNDPSCGPQPPVDCKTNPDDPSCTPSPPVDCKATPDDPSCKVDCTINPSDPSCQPPPCQSAVIGISCPPVDCTKNPDDPSCPPIHIDCPEKVGFTLRAIENGKCVYDPIKCKQGEQLVNNKCEHIDCPQRPLFTVHIENGKCVYEPVKCPQGESVINDSCSPCPPDARCPPSCSKDQHFDINKKKCVPDNPCPPGFHLQKGVCTKNIVINVKKKITTTVETVFRNLFVNPNQPKFLLLLDTAQLCQLAGDTQCVAKQNQFDTLNLITKLDSTGKTWTITGQVENRAVSKIQRNVQVTAYFYDSKGNSVGGPYKGTVNPTVLKSLQLGAFSMKPSTSIMKGTPTFIRLEYQSTTAATP
jgi:hypothetical protein